MLQHIDDIAVGIDLFVTQLLNLIVDKIYTVEYKVSAPAQG